MPDAAAFPPDWLVPDWPCDPRVRAFVTTRAGGVSRGAYASLNFGGGGAQADDPHAVAENRRRVAAHLPAPPVWLHQVHGIEVVSMKAAPLDESAVSGAAGDLPVA